MQKLGAHTSSTNPVLDEKLGKVTELDSELQELYDSVSEYLIAAQTMQSASLKVASTFSKIMKTEDPSLQETSRVSVSELSILFVIFPVPT